MYTRTLSLKKADTKLALVFMAAAVILRLVYYYGFFEGMITNSLRGWQILLPTLSGLFFCAYLPLISAKKATEELLLIPVYLGIIFFIAKALGFESGLHTFLCCLLYILVGVLFTLTWLGRLRPKLPLVLVFALPLLYHIFVEDLLILLRRPMPWYDWMPELSVLCIMAALLCTAWAMEEK